MRTAQYLIEWMTANSSSDIAVTGVSLDVSSGAVPKGTTKQLTATVAPANATNKAVV